MHMFLDNFHQGREYSAQIASYQAELRREEKITGQKYLSISSLHTDYLNIDSSSGSGINSDRENLVQKKCTFCGGANHYTEKCFKRIIKDNKKACADSDTDKQRTERKLPKCFRCVYGDHLNSKCPKQSKYKYKRQKQVHFSERVNCELKE